MSARIICPEGKNQPLLILKKQKYAQNTHSSACYDYEVKSMKSSGANEVPIDRFAKKGKK